MLAAYVDKRLNGEMIKLTKKKKIILAATVIAAALLSVFLLTRGEDIVTEITQPDKKYFSQITGAEVSKDESEQPILGVMIENSEEARPQSGLDSAGVVFETVTEGGITRYLALYQEKMPEVVGPVRSARPAFVNWLTGFDASLAHVGGSAEALELIDQYQAKSMNQYFNDAQYYRRNDREAPHDVYAKTKDLRDLQKELKHKKATFAEIPRSNDSPSATPTASLISLEFSHPIFGVQFKYDATTNSYARSLAGAPHLDEITNQPITVKNLVVVKMTGDINALGSGEAFLYKDGIVETVRWQQSDFDSRIKLLDSSGTEVAMNRGDTWFSVLPGNGTVTNQ
ncbi:DUF3048 domain-containing protein [Candidatus Saccharibacteria bacterium]|nr:DUF3048 domain-containing protein [Candidatus Saccharibacteria bacterium]